MALQTTRIRQLAARGRSVADISARLGVSKVDVCRILTMQAEQAEVASLQKWKAPLAKTPREESAPRAPKPAPVPKPPSSSQVSDNGAYMPTRAEIREKCREIRNTWSNHERLSRYWLARTDSWTISAQQLRELAIYSIPIDVVPLVA